MRHLPCFADRLGLSRQKLDHSKSASRISLALGDGPTPGLVQILQAFLYNGFCVDEFLRRTGYSKVRLTHHSQIP
jgi:hypothetical protein